MTKLLMLLVATLLITSAAAATKKQPASNCRDATTGQYVTADYAKAHPDTTVCEAKPAPKK